MSRPTKTEQERAAGLVREWLDACGGFLQYAAITDGPGRARLHFFGAYVPGSMPPYVREPVGSYPPPRVANLTGLVGKTLGLEVPEEGAGVTVELAHPLGVGLRGVARLHSADAEQLAEQLAEASGASLTWPDGRRGPLWLSEV